MFDHVTIRVSDREESLRLYRTIPGREPKGEFLLDPDGNGVEAVNHDR